MPVCPADDGAGEKGSGAPDTGADSARTLSDVARKEEETLTQWREKRIFERTLEATKNGEEYVFYDGPPFATGLPHYGHLLAGTMKDTMPRYHTMKGRHVRRQWGWDCHGLPVEVLIEKELGLKSKKDVEEYGIGAFNERARGSVMRYDEEWKKIVPRMGRFIDMDHAYKTMDTSYTESVWWAFAELDKKGLITKGYRSMHMCPRCQTTLSNNEVSQGYKDVKDLSVIAKFELVDDGGEDGDAPLRQGSAGQARTYVLAWTTTPWTLPGNVALAVGEDVLYVIVLADGARYIVAKDRVEDVFEKVDIKEYVVVEEVKGSELVGKSYKPLFPYYAEDKNLEHRENGWKIYAGDFVTTDEGTGIVHIAPAFGEDDLTLGKKYDLPFIQHVDGAGMVKQEVEAFAGMAVKPKSDDEKERIATDIEVIKYLQEHGTFFAKEKYEHSYPHCWRCDTPLLNYATDAWFVDVQQLKARALEENKTIGWVPEAIGSARFANLIEGAPDWNISRQRFWGAPLPVWENERGERLVIEGVDALKKYVKTAGNTYAIMRHGEGEHNVAGVLSGLPENPHHVTEKGKSEIAATVAKMKQDGFMPDVIIASPLVRTQETAALVAEGLGLSKDVIVTDARIKEDDFGDFEGKPETIDDEYFANTYEWITKKRPNGESYVDVKRRMSEALYACEKEYAGKTILFVTHDGPARMLFEGAQGKTIDEIVDTYEGQEGVFLHTGTYRMLDFMPLPHNVEYELDLHRPYIDEVVIEKDGVAYTRIPDVFDCWFESGSMPFAQFGYPAKGADTFQKNFPADFIAEGLDQTRGWFYTLLMLGVGLFDAAPYRHVIVNGLILAEDGKKMSKKLKNYPDPMELADRYGADAIRLYLLNSPAVRGEDLRFSEKGVDEMYKKVIARLENVVAFYELVSLRDKRVAGQAKGGEEVGDVHTLDILDQWIYARLRETVRVVTHALDAYELDRATRPFVDFLDDLSTWYVRRSRERMKGEDEEARRARAVLRDVLRITSIILAPFTPFVAERVYEKAGDGKESVHLETWPACIDNTHDEEVIATMQKVRDVVSNALEVRKREGVKVRQPLATLFVSEDGAHISGEQYAALIKDEVNVKAVVVDASKTENGVGLDLNLTDELRREGQVREFLRAVQDARKAKGLSPEDVATLVVVKDAIAESLIGEYKEMIQKTASLGSIVFEEHIENGTEATLGESEVVVFALR